MGSYTTLDRVQARLPRLPAFTAATTVTADQVADLIDQHEAEIETALSFIGYATPVTSPSSLVVWLTKIATEGVAAAVLKSWYQDATGPNSESQWSVMEKRYQAALQRIWDGKLPSGSGSGISSWTTDYAGADSPLAAEADPVVTMDADW